MKKVIFALLATSLFACNPLSNVGLSSSPSSASSVTPGESKVFQGHSVKSWSKSSEGQLQELGFTVPKALIEASSTVINSDPWSLKLDMPASEQSSTVINHVSVDYSPGGHPPPNVYDVPHFDVHFYFQTQAEMATVDCKDTTLPSAEHIPQPYMFFPPNAPECVPTMGYHSLNPASPELAPSNPSKFDKTMVLGYYKGEMNFIEPMIARDYLIKENTFSQQIAKPAHVDKAGLYPTKFDVRPVGDNLEFVLSEFK